MDLTHRALLGLAVNPFTTPEAICIRKRPQDARAGIQRLASIVAANFERDPIGDALYCFFGCDCEKVTNRLGFGAHLLRQRIDWVMLSFINAFGVPSAAIMVALFVVLLPVSPVASGALKRRKAAVELF